MNPDVTLMVQEGAALDDDQFDAPTAWRFSNLGKCYRNQVLDRLGVKKPALAYGTRFIFELGHVIEEIALKWLSLCDRVDILAKQVRVNAYQFGARGRADALVRMGNQLVPVEVKSTRNQALAYRIPYPNHRLQAGAYAWFLGLPRAVLLYIGRDGALAEAWVEVEQHLKDEISEHWETLNKFWEAAPDDLPPRLPLRTVDVKKGRKVVGQKQDLDSECGYCPYKNICWTGTVPNPVSDRLFEESPSPADSEQAA